MALVDSAGDEQPLGVAVQPDGTIVVAGWTSVDDDLAVYRLTADGKPDNSFDDDGARGIDAVGDERVYAVALQADGEIVVAGDSYVAAPSIRWSRASTATASPTRASVPAAGARLSDAGQLLRRRRPA